MLKLLFGRDVVRRCPTTTDQNFVDRFYIFVSRSQEASELWKIRCFAPFTGCISYSMFEGDIVLANSMGPDSVPNGSSSTRNLSRDIVKLLESRETVHVLLACVVATKWQARVELADWVQCTVTIHVPTVDSSQWT